jgi:ketosteroid isomerase-like protein
MANEVRTMIEKLTREYARAFGAKDLAAIERLLADDFVLEDPTVIRLEGKSEALAEMKRIFDSNPGKFELRCRNVLVDGARSVIEFEFELENLTLKGVDVIEWQGNQMTALRAYLDTR